MLGECLLKSSLPGKALRTLVDIARLAVRTLVDIARLAERFDMRSQIRHAFSKPSLENLISKDANLVFYLLVYPLLNTLQTSDMT